MHGAHWVAVALRPGSPSAKKAEAEGIKVDTIIARVLKETPRQAATA